jgi:hypothetical protein
MYMLKVLAGIIALNLLLLNKCNTMRNTDDKTFLDADIFCNNSRLSISYDDSKDLILTVEKLLSECDDIYELLVTDKLIEGIKKDDDYLEIVYPEKREIRIGLIETISVYRLLIPLSGKFAASDQLSFFCGYPEYSSGPYIKNNGLKMLSDMVQSHRKDK